MGDAGKLRRRANAAAALLAAVLAVLAGAARAAGPTDVRAVPFIVPQHFANTNVNRQIDLGVPTIVREVVAVTARNTASAPDGAYFVAFDSVLADLSLGTVQANVKGDKEKLVVEKAAYDATRSVGPGAEARPV